MLRLVKKTKNDNRKEITFFDVKELYDEAYAEKEQGRVNLKKFKKLMTKATLMDMAYRAQMTKVTPFEYKKAA